MGTRRTIRLAVVAAAVGALALPAATHAAPVTDAFHKPLEDGCQRNVPGLLTYSSPEWVWVNSAQAQNEDNTRQLEGLVRDPHTAGEDLPENHLSYDFDFNVVPDPSYTYLAGGSPAANGGKGSGNWDHSVPDEYGTLHLEWESAVVPTFAWPDEGDRVSVWGQWIWDCGHWGEGFDFSAPPANDPTAPLTHNGDYLIPGETESELQGTPEAKNIRGEQTELHPLEALVVHRAVPYQAVARESETDAYISTKGTGAHAEEKCSHDLKPPAGQPFQGPAFTACVHDTSNEYQSLSGKTFSFVVAAPPRPSPHARLRYREIQRIPSHHATERVTPAGDGLHVTISFDKVAAGTLEDFGRSWFVGWEGDRSGTPTHLRWTLESIKVNKSLDPNPSRAQQTGVPPGEYNVYVDINGFWQFVGGRGPTGAVTGGAPTQWIPGLGAVTDGQVFSNINRSVDFFVPPGKPVRLFVDTRECDLPHMDPCALTTELSDGNDAPGDHADTFPSAAAALGEHKLVPSGDDYEMTYRVDRIASFGPGPTPPGSTGIPSSTPSDQRHLHCSDVRAPVSWFAPAGAVSVSSHGLRLRGRASDDRCGVDRVAVAVSQHLGHHRCRYLRADGKLAHTTKCSRPRWLRATGRTHWVLRTAHALPAGAYVAHVIAVDRAGNIELYTHRTGPHRNYIGFRVP